MLYPKSAASVEIITEHIQPDGIHQELDRRYFRNLPIPDPQPQFGGKSTQDTCISLAEVRNTDFLVATHENFDWDGSFKIAGFQLLLLQRSSGTLIVKAARSARLTADQKSMLESAEVGDTLYVEDIVIALPDGSRRSLPYMKFELTH